MTAKDIPFFTCLQSKIKSFLIAGSAASQLN
jgi:hypothetical protein